MIARHALRIGLLAVVLTGCFMKKKDDAPQQPGNNFEPVVLEVDNKNWQEIVIYAIANGSRTRLGSVAGINQKKINVPINAVRLPGSVELLLDPLGGRASFRTGVISVGPGNHIRLTVQNELRLTSWTVQ